MQLHERAALPIGHLIDPEELRDPVGFLRSEHDEQREFCHRLDRLLDNLGAEENAAVALSLWNFLFGDMSLNMKAEEKALAPLLCERCAPEDTLDAILDDTWKAHNLIALLLPDIGYGLACLADGELPETPLGFIAQSLEFIEIVQRHLDREDLLLLNLARFRLTTADYDRLGHALARQHGIDFPTDERITGPAASAAETPSAMPEDPPGMGMSESWRRAEWRRKKAVLFDILH